MTFSQEKHDCSKCTRCQENNYCKECSDWRYRVVEWSSNNKDIESLIKECTKVQRFFEWIPFERFTNVEYLAKGGFGSIYKATWLDGPLLAGYWDS